MKNRIERITDILNEQRKNIDTMFSSYDNNWNIIIFNTPEKYDIFIKEIIREHIWMDKEDFDYLIKLDKQDLENLKSMMEIQKLKNKLNFLESNIN